MRPLSCAERLISEVSRPGPCCDASDLAGILEMMTSFTFKQFNDYIKRNYHTKINSTPVQERRLRELCMLQESV